MKAIDWKITGSAPDFSSANQLSTLGSSNILKGLESLSNTAKAYGDKVTSDNTQELMSMLNKAKTPEELDSTVRGLMDFASSNYGSNYDKATLNTAIESRPQLLQQRVVNNNIYDTSVKSKADEGRILSGLLAVNNGDVTAYNQAASGMKTPQGFSTIYTAALNAEAVKQDRIDKDNDLAYKFASLQDRRLAAEAEAAAKLRIEAAKNSSNTGGSGKDKTVVQSEGNGTNGDIIYNLGANGLFSPNTINVLSGAPISGREATISYMLDKTRKLEGGKGRPHYTLAEQKAGIGSSAAGDLGLTKGTAKTIINTNLPALTKEFGLNAKQLMEIVQNQNINPAAYSRIGEYGMNMEVDKLEENGILVNPATLRGAWWLGSDGINKLMKNPNLSMNTISGVNWAKTQKRSDWANMTGAEFAKVLEQQTGYSLDGTPLGSASNSINSETNQGIPRKDIIPLQKKYAQQIQAYVTNPTLKMSATERMALDTENDELWNKLSGSNQGEYNAYFTSNKLIGLSPKEKNILFKSLQSRSDNATFYDTDKESRDVLDSFIKNRDKYKYAEKEAQFAEMLTQAKPELAALMKQYKMDEKGLTDTAVAGLIFPPEYLKAFADVKKANARQTLMDTAAQVKMKQTVENNKPRNVTLSTQGAGGLMLTNAATIPEVPKVPASRTQVAEEVIRQNAASEVTGSPFDMPDVLVPKVVTPVNPRQILNAQNMSTQQKTDMSATLTREAKVLKAKQEQEAAASRAKELTAQAKRTADSLALQKQQEAQAKIKADKANADSAAKVKAMEEAKKLALAKQKADADKAAKAKADADLVKAKAKLQATASKAVAKPIPKAVPIGIANPTAKPLAPPIKIQFPTTF